MANKPRLVLVSGSFPKIQCGVSGHTELIARLTAQRREYDVHVLTADDPLVDPSLAQGYTLHCLVKKWHLFHARALARTILSLQPDLVHIQNPTIKHYRFHALTMSVVVPYLKKLAPALPVIVTQHDLAVGRSWGRWRYYPLFHAADAVCVSNSRDEQAVLAQKIAPHKVYRAPVSSHFADPPARTPAAIQAARRFFNIDPALNTLAYFGYIHPGRNIHVLLQALHHLNQRGQRLHTLIIGGPFPKHQDYYEHCRNLADRFHLQPYLTWTGFAQESQIAQGLLAAEVFISLLERGADLRNTSIISAMLAQLPIITTVNPRFYVDRDLQILRCRLVNPHAPQAVAEEIVQALHCPPDAEFLARRAELFRPEKIWRQHIDTHQRAYRRLPPVPFTSSC